MLNKSRLLILGIALLSFLCGGNIFAQNLILNWQNCFNQKDHNIYGMDICHVAAKYFIACTFIKDGYTNYRIIQLDNVGNYINEFDYGGSSSDFIEKIEPTTHGCYFLAGVTLSVDGDVTNNPYPGSDNFWIVKIDSLGNKIWDKVVGGTYYENLRDATATLDGGIVAFGWSYSNDGDITHPYGAFDMWAVKLDSTGNKCWDFSLGSSEFEYANGIIATSDSGFLLMGLGDYNTDGNISCENISSSDKGLLAKIDKNGILQWDRCYGGTNSSILSRALEIDDGYIIGGSTACDDGDMEGSGYHYGFDNDIPTKDIWLSKIDFDGNIIWQRCYGGSSWEYVNAIEKDGQGNLLLFGNTHSFDGDVVGNHSISKYDPDIWILKVDIDNGHLIWQQCFGGNGREDLEHGVVQKNDSTWVIAATAKGPPTGSITCSPPDPQEYMDYYIWTFEVTDTNLYVSAAKLQAVQVSIIPNPVKDWVEVDYVLPATSEKAVLTITDLTGRILITTLLSGKKGQKSIDVSQLTQGTFLCTIHAGNIKQSHKLVIVH